MITRLSILIIILSLSLFSCEKESTPSLNGAWVSIAIYKKNDLGNFEWVGTQRAPQVATFNNNNNRFTFFTDVPGGAGTYQYDRSTSKLQLNFEKDSYGNQARQEIQKIESICEQELITVTLNASGDIAYKIKYFKSE